MCDPISLMTAAATGLSAVGQIQAGNAAASAAQANAVVQERNAIRSEQQAKDAIMRGQLEEERKRREGAQIIGSQKARSSAANLDIGYGSPMDAIISTAANIELDALTIRESARREADDFEMQAYNQRAGAAIGRAEGKNAKTSAFIGAGSSILSGGAKIYKYKAETS